jgi:hypothetical protein
MTSGAGEGPVFIIGGSRTGSEMLKTMLCESPEQDFVDELFLLCPAWLHPDLASGLERHVGDLTADGALDRLVAFLYSGKPYGWFWEHAEEQLDSDLLRKRLQERPLSLRNLFDAVMRTHADMRGKTRLGAKFPTHYSYTDRLLEWYPDCRLLHTTREPKAVYASQSAKHTSADDPAWDRAAMRFKQFVHINLQVSWTGHWHRRLAGRENYRLVRYEDIVGNPEASLRGICAFLRLEFHDRMLNPKRYGSSFVKVRGARGIDSASVERWRRELSPLTARLIDTLHPLARRRLGYGGRGERHTP